MGAGAGFQASTGSSIIAANLPIGFQALTAVSIRLTPSFTSYILIIRPNVCDVKHFRVRVWAMPAICWRARLAAVAGGVTGLPPSRGRGRRHVTGHPSTVLVRSGPAAVVQATDGAPEGLGHQPRIKLRVLGRVGLVLGLRTRGPAAVVDGPRAAAPYGVHVARLEPGAALARALALGLERRLAALAQTRAFLYLT